VPDCVFFVLYFDVLLDECVLCRIPFVKRGLSIVFRSWSHEWLAGEGMEVSWS